MKFGTLSGKKSPEELFHDYTETYVGNRQPIPRGEFGGVKLVLDSQWAKEQPWYEAYQMAREQDFSKFEQVPPLVRNFLASVYMVQLMQREASSHAIPKADPASKNQPLPDFSPGALGYELSGNTEGISVDLQRFLEDNKHNPLTRLGFSLYSHPDTAKVKSRAERENEQRKCERFQYLNERMTEMIMEDTLRPMSVDQIKNTRIMAGSEAAGDEMVQANIEKQVQVAKLMFLAHVGRTFITTSTTNEKGEVVSSKEENLTQSVASMVSHCSRTGFVLPPGTSVETEQMMDAVLGSNTGQAAGIYGRLAATHSTENGTSVKQYKELKGVCLRKQYGMDLAIGGLGMPGVRGAAYKKQMIKNDGTCGHMYLHINKGDEGKISSLLVGFESDAPHKTNQMGHTHTSKAAQESMSSFLGQRDDEMGDKYGGRTVDCTMYDPEKLKELIDTFADRYRSMMFQAIKGEKSNTMKESMAQANAMLSGKVMSPKTMEIFLNKVGFTKREAGEMAISIADSRKVWNKKQIEDERSRVNTFDANERGMEPMQELKKPGFRTRFKAAFGSKEALEKIQEYKKAFAKRANRIRMTFLDLDQIERKTTLSAEKKKGKEIQRKIENQESLKTYPKKEPVKESDKGKKSHFWKK